MFNVYNDHKGCHVSFPWVQSVAEVEDLANVAARIGTDSFFRVFRVVSGGERFETAFSVLGGVVREHRDVTIPAAHW